MKSFEEKFRPPTHFEVATDKPLSFPIGDSKWVYQHHLMRAVDFVRFHSLATSLMAQAEETARAQAAKGNVFDAGSVSIIRQFAAMILLAYEVCDKPKSFWGRLKLKRFMLSYYLDHTDKLFKVFEMLLTYNGRLLHFTPWPSDMATVPSASVDSDWFLQICDTEGAHLLPWIVLCERYEKRKQQSIGEHESAKRARERRGR